MGRNFIEAFTDTKEINARMLQTKGKLAFDVGANGGYVAKTLARAFDKVIAIEPAIESYTHLIPRCPIPNLICLNIAVSDHVGSVTLGMKSWTDTHGELFTGNSLEPWGPDLDEREVPCTTLDTLALEHGYPDFIKIDTEGHEAYIVDGAHRCFDRHPAFIIEIHDAKWGDYIGAYFDTARISYREVRHHAYSLDEPDYTNHYWMVDTKS